MSENWANRQRRTNQLVRRIAEHVLQRNVDGSQLLGLCRLTWITKSYADENASYIWSTKVPALSEALGLNLTGLSLQAVASAVAREIQDQEIEPLILSHTGFTNFYNAYRNSARIWAEENKDVLAEIFRTAYSLRSDAEGKKLIEKIAVLPSIPKANNPDTRMPPEDFVTPACFALDPRVRFPIINGATHVKELLNTEGTKDTSVVGKYLALVNCIGRDGVTDAADIDQLRGIHSSAILENRPESGKNLPVKDEDDVKRLQGALSTVQRRIHNKMTNQLRRIMADWTLLEGKLTDCMYDVMVRNYDGSNDLLIEVKSACDSSQIRMAIGQMYAYWHRLKGSTPCHCAVLLPSRPDEKIEDLLSWLEIGYLWIEDDCLVTGVKWLAGVADFRSGR